MDDQTEITDTLVPRTNNCKLKNWIIIKLVKRLSKNKSRIKMITLVLITLDIVLFIALEFFDYLNQFEFKPVILINKIIEVKKIKIKFYKILKNLVHFKFLFFNSFNNNNKKIKSKNH